MFSSKYCFCFIYHAIETEIAQIDFFCHSSNTFSSSHITKYHIISFLFFNSSIKLCFDNLIQSFLKSSISSIPSHKSIIFSCIFHLYLESYFNIKIFSNTGFFSRYNTYFQFIVFSNSSSISNKFLLLNSFISEICLFIL